MMLITLLLAAAATAIDLEGSSGLSFSCKPVIVFSLSLPLHAQFKNLDISTKRNRKKKTVNAYSSVLVSSLRRDNSRSSVTFELRSNLSSLSSNPAAFLSLLAKSRSFSLIVCSLLAAILLPFSTHTHTLSS